MQKYWDMPSKLRREDRLRQIVSNLDVRRDPRTNRMNLYEDFQDGKRDQYQKKSEKITYKLINQGESGVKKEIRSPKKAAVPKELNLNFEYYSPLKPRVPRYDRSVKMLRREDGAYESPDNFKANLRMRTD